jgi:hypothetical protein
MDYHLRPSSVAPAITILVLLLVQTASSPGDRRS